MIVRVIYSIMLTFNVISVDISWWCLHLVFAIARRNSISGGAERQLSTRHQIQVGYPAIISSNPRDFNRNSQPIKTTGDWISSIDPVHVITPKTNRCRKTPARPLSHPSATGNLSISYQITHKSPQVIEFISLATVGLFAKRKPTKQKNQVKTHGWSNKRRRRRWRRRRTMKINIQSKHW